MIELELQGSLYLQEKRQMKFFGRIMRKEGTENLTLTELTECKELIC